MQYNLKNMTGDEAKRILQNAVEELSSMEPEDLTTFERSLLRSCVVNPPSSLTGAEERILADSHKLSVSQWPC